MPQKATASIFSLGFALLTASCRSLGAGPGLPVPPDAFDPEATQFEYPYPVSFFAFRSQGQELRMAYIDALPRVPNGDTVVLLHGKNFCAADWASTIASLTGAGFRVIAPDQIGFGKSSKPASYQFSFNQLAANTHALLLSLGIDRSAVVGHSMGGMLAIRYTLEYPQATERLVLVDPIGLEDYAALVGPRTVDDWYAQELKQTPQSVREYQRSAYYGGAWTPEYESHTRLLAGWTRHPQWPRVAWDSALVYDMIFTQPVVADLSRIRAPARLIVGLRDHTALGRQFASPDVAKTMGDYARLGKEAQGRIPGADLVEIPSAGHVPQVESFAAFERALLEFLQR